MRKHTTRRCRKQGQKASAVDAGAGPWDASASARRRGPGASAQGHSIQASHERLRHMSFRRHMHHAASAWATGGLYKTRGEAGRHMALSASHTSMAKRARPRHEEADGIRVTPSLELLAATISGGLISAQTRRPSQKWVCRWSFGLAERMVAEAKRRRLRARGRE